jgi:hypothetical protein
VKSVTFDVRGVPGGRYGRRHETLNLEDWRRNAVGRRTIGRDLVDEITEERSRDNPAFAEIVEAALRTRQLVRALTQRRREMGIIQTVVAARMGTSQSALARLETGGSDPRVSTREVRAGAR